MSKSLPASITTGSSLAWWRQPPARVGIALAASLLVHSLLVNWPVAITPAPASLPALSARLDKMPPPPAPAAHQPRRAKTRPNPAAPQTALAVAAPIAEPEREFSPRRPKPEPPPAPSLAYRLPPRIDLVYKVLTGERQFMIGQSTLRFSHDADRYVIETMGEARGVAALIYRGQFKLLSRGLITSDGLQPLEFIVERGSPDQREVTRFDWPARMLTIKDQPPLALVPPTYDLLSFMLQFYMQPPKDRVVRFHVASTRKLYEYVFDRVGDDVIDTPLGAIPTQHWKRRVAAGDLEAELWLAPDFYYIPVKIRLASAERGSAEQVLQSILADPPSDTDNPS